MPTYKVVITETYQKAVAVVAASESEAHRRVQDAWSNAEVVLDDGDFKGSEFFVSGETGDTLDKVERKG